MGIVIGVGEKAQSPGIILHKYGSLLSDKLATAIQWVKGSLFNT